MQTIKIQSPEIFQALADLTRLRIMRVLIKTNEKACLCELADSLMEPQYNLSRHLKILRQAGLLIAEKQGRWVYHELAHKMDKAKFLPNLYQLIKVLPDNNGIFVEDLSRFRKRLLLREKGRCNISAQALLMNRKEYK
ncbi:Arsenical resistance operon repressor [Legionella jordanis]|uniref:Arsenical resistance operon repressor n=1 Tax=Legionella jordanis TaxID=456 RepID=A0A0W0VBH8_9GAMM|nr:metalloregulator ArsR/SmtB family transcription factor [Legionella jordanis]KTD17457.1 Arsenical resistance operon repressor [Legionella jordanis]VEH13426.1 Arsenical resistance operon repressor [Legionella jordanis]